MLWKSSAGTLVISFIGMKPQEVAIKPVVKVSLHSDAEMLDEVMVVAYGTAKKSSFTGSASVVSSEEIGKIQSSNVANALSGKVSGVQLNNVSGQPGATSPTIRVRGISSINAGNDPLIVLDGVPYDGDMNNISSQDIESMTVLKDAASNALYGARGANGVIIITTKKGNSGKARVTVDAKWGSNSRGVQDYNIIKSPAQYYEMYYGALKSFYVNAEGMTPSQAHIATNQNMIDPNSANTYSLGYNVYNIPEGQFLIGTNGKLNPNATLGNIVEYGGQQYLLSPDNWLDEVYNHGLRQEYNVNVSAGTDKSSFYASVSYLNNEGITAKSDYERLNGRLKADYQVNDWLKVGANLAYIHFNANSLTEDGSSSSSGNVFAIATQMAPIYPMYIRDAQGNILYDSNGFKRYDYGDGYYAEGNNTYLERPYMSGANAYASNILDENNSEGNGMNASGFVDIRFLKDFKFTWNSSVFLDETRQTSYTNPYYGQYASQNGIVNKSHTRSLAFNHQQILNWKRSFENHNLDVMIGHEAYKYKYYYLYASKSNMFDPTNHELAGAITDGSSNSYTTDYNTEGYFGRIQYDYAEKYFLSGSYRRDASSRFHPDNRWGNFWSAGAAWIVSKEDFFNVDWINLLKVKASYGSQGNDNIGNYRYVNTYTIVNSGGEPAAVPETMGNKDITWETNGNFNAGIEFELFNSRFNGSIEYFLRQTTDMLFSFPLAPSFGYSSYYANVGDMRNQGVEIELTGTPIKTKDITWDIRLNLTHYKNKIIYLPEERKSMSLGEHKGFSSGDKFFGEGLPLYTYRMKQYAGVNENGEALYYMDQKDSEGNVTRVKTTNYSSATFYDCGTALPDAYGGFGTTFSYKGFDFSADFNYQIGGQVYDSDYASMMSSPGTSSKGSNFHADLLNSWTPENPNSNIPRLQFDDQFTASSSDRFLTNASYLSLQNVTFGYTLPASVTRKAGIEKIRLYFAGENLWLWSKRQGLDPRQSISGNVTSSYYAPMRTISGGITLTF
ncbi:TonB-dependent receptor [uncultured Bacteroides sp.]|uniref:SusC/RagA family TonB-linked outer membrane protein n=1 Tax=uncultured Bacteroides sp. TaxID=162156 RepID=UPI002625FCB4|nr:TonB-dependent receptor [uncultured Bacteroides sp.]